MYMSGFIIELFIHNCPGYFSFLVFLEHTARRHGESPFMKDKHCGELMTIATFDVFRLPQILWNRDIFEPQKKLAHCKNFFFFLQQEEF